jgi:hypothetical protein
MVKQTLIDQNNRAMWRLLGVTHSDYAASFKRHASELNIEHHLKQSKAELD